MFQQNITKMTVSLFAEECAAAARLKDTMRAVAGRYCSVLTHFSCFQSPQRDRILFEPLYELLSLAVAASFPAEHRHRRGNQPSNIFLSALTMAMMEMTNRRIAEHSDDGDDGDGF